MSLQSRHSAGWLLQGLAGEGNGQFLRSGEKCTLTSGFLAAQFMCSDLLFCLACRALTHMVLRLRWHCGMGEMIKKLLRATQYDVMNSELEVKGPQLYTQLSSNELHEFEQMTIGL